MPILLMQFLDESENFVNGFECGKLWEQISNNLEIQNLPIHSTNIEQIKLMCDSNGYICTFEDCHDGCWHFLTCKPIDITNLK